MPDPHTTHDVKVLADIKRYVAHELSGLLDTQKYKNGHGLTEFGEGALSEIKRLERMINGQSPY